MADTLAYPVKLKIDYPDHLLNRVSSFFRIFAMIPIAIVFALLTGAEAHWGQKSGGWLFGAGTGAGIIFLPTLLLILFRQKYPRWWYDFSLGVTRFSGRIFSYFALMTDVYPSTDEEQSVHIEITYPDAKNELNRWLPVFKWLLAIPHYFILCILGIAALFCIIIAWFSILFTSTYPHGLFDFVAGVYRWALRVSAYALMLVTDKYPPFSIE